MSNLKVVRNDKKIKELDSAVQKVKAFEDGLNQIVLEREDEVSTSVTAIIAGLNVLFLGPPGTAKSYLVKAISQALRFSYFEIVMNPTTEPNELLGGYDLTELSKGKYVRRQEGMITEAELVFLDEVFKSNSACLNLMLPILNERKYKVGNKMTDLPVVSIFGASNELPAQDEGLGAMYDRWQVKHWVKPMNRADNVKKVMWGKIPSPEDVFTGKQPALSMEDIQSIRSAAELVTISAEVERATVKIRDRLFKETHTLLSDRKMVQWAKYLKADAAKKGKTFVSPEELFSSACLLWDDPSHLPTVKEVVGEIACPWVLEIERVQHIISNQEIELERMIDDECGGSLGGVTTHTERQAYINTIAVNLSMELDRIEDIRKKHKGRSSDLLDDLETKIKEIKDEALSAILK